MGPSGIFFYEVSREGRGIHPATLDKWLKKATPDDTGLTRPPTVSRVSTHKDEFRSIDHGYFQSQFRMSVYKEVGRLLDQHMIQSNGNKFCRPSFFFHSQY